MTATVLASGLGTMLGAIVADQSPARVAAATVAVMVAAALGLAARARATRT